MYDDDDYYQCEYCNDICDICRGCVDHQCECTKADREVYELRQEVDDLKGQNTEIEKRIDVLEKWAKTYYYILCDLRKTTSSIVGKGESV